MVKKWKKGKESKDEFDLAYDQITCTVLNIMPLYKTLCQKFFYKITRNLKKRHDKKVKIIFVGDHFYGNKNYSNPQCAYAVKLWKEFYNLCQVTTLFETKQSKHKNKAFKFFQNKWNNLMLSKMYANTIWIWCWKWTY